MSEHDIQGSKGSTKTHTPVESPDSLINTSYANILDAISEGPIVGLKAGAQSIYFDQTPLGNPDGTLNFTGVSWEQRTGEADQDYIPGFPAVEAENAVGVALTAAQPWTQAISNNQLSAVRIRLGASTLYQSESDGDTVGAAVQYVVDLSTDNSDYVEVLNTAFTGKTTTGYQRSHRIDLPPSAGGWRIRVRRLTPDKQTGIQAVTSVIGYTEVIDAKLQYPFTALVGSKIDASQFSSIPERAFRIRGRIVQVPSNYDQVSRSYSGTWDGTFKLAWTDNPAWIYRDLILNDRYGLGQVIKAAQVDKWSLYQIAQYADQQVDNGQGGTEPRFTCNLYLQTRANALQVLQDLASIFRGMSYYAGTEVMVSADMPSDPVYTYTNGNVINGKFSRAASSGSTRYSVCKVSWSDTENFGNVRTEYVTRQDALQRYGVRETELTAFGCTSQGQAQRLGQYTLLTNSLETETISFSVGLDGVIARPGQLVRVADEFFAGKPIGGRIKAATAKTVTLDNDVTASAGDALIVILPTGTAEKRVIQAVAGRKITVTQSFTAIPVAQSIYAIETAELVTEVYRILTVAENFGDDKLQYDVVAIQHNASKFAAIDNGAQIVRPPVTVLPSAVQAIPSNVALSTFDAIKQGINVATMRIEWEPAAGAVYYQVWWRRGSSDWINAGVTYTNSLEVAGIYTDTYTARVSAVGVSGNSSLWAYSPATDLQGKTGTPPAVTSLTAASQLFGIALAWTFPPGAEDTQRTEVWYGTSPTLAAASKLSDLAYPQRDYVLQNLKAGATFYFWARLVDRTGNVGPFYPTGNGVQGIASTDPSLILDQIVGQVGETQLGQELAARIDLIDGTGPGSVNDRLEDLKDSIGDLADALVYDPAKAYKVGETVRLGQRLYTAKVAVPAAAGNAPPNAAFWLDTGQVVQTANGLALQVQQNSADITQAGQDINSQAQQLSAVKSTVNDPATGIQATASGLNSLKSTVSSLDGKVTAAADKVDGVYAQVYPALAGDTAGLAGNEQILVGVWSEQSARIEDGIAIGKRIDTVQVSVVATSAAVQNEATARATADAALASQVSTVQATANSASAAVQTVSSAQAATDGKLAAMYSVKLQVNANGQYVYAGFGVGIENQAGVLQSQFLITADKFVVMNTVNGVLVSPFAIQGGQVIIADGVIGAASIGFAKISDSVQSDNYIAGSQGWRFSKAGGIDINAAGAKGRSRLTGSDILMYDGAGTLRIRMSVN
jgi:predicted phage tail protein